MDLLDRVVDQANPAWTLIAILANAVLIVGALLAVL
jgi:hypothetical protein